MRADMGILEEFDTLFCDVVEDAMHMAIVEEYVIDRIMSHEMWKKTGISEEEYKQTLQNTSPAELVILYRTLTNVASARRKS
jgi:hypothetical protein